MAVSPRKRRRRSPRKAKRASSTQWWRTALDTWPKKIAAAVGGALFASAMSYFIGADFWHGVERKVGTAGPPVQITTLTDIDRFDSDLGHFPEFIVDRPIERSLVPRTATRRRAVTDGRRRWAGVDASASLIRVVSRARPIRQHCFRGFA